MDQAICEQCGKPCDIVEIYEDNPEEFWGVPCMRREYMDVSDCCHAEFYDEPKPELCP